MPHSQALCRRAASACMVSLSEAVSDHHPSQSGQHSRARVMVEKATAIARPRPHTKQSDRAGRRTLTPLTRAPRARRPVSGRGRRRGSPPRSCAASSPSAHAAPPSAWMRDARCIYPTHRPVYVRQGSLSARLGSAMDGPSRMRRHGSVRRARAYEDKT
jgi:hypothetical protein